MAMLPAVRARRIAALIGLFALLTSARVFAADSLNVTFRYDDPGRQRIRVYVPGQFNNWGSNVGGQIAITDTSRMWYDSAGEYWWKSFRLAVDSTYAYKFHFHLDSAGASWLWIADPLNTRLDNSGFGNSLITTTSPLLFEAKASRDESGLLTGIRASLAGNAVFTSVLLVVDGDTTEILPYYNAQHGALVYSLPSPRQASAATLTATDALARSVTTRWSFPPPVPPKHWENEIAYQIFPRSFYDSDGDSVGDFNGIASKLDYLQQLGVTAIWMNPIQLSHAYHNYFADNFDSTDTEFGTNGDFVNLVKAVHAHGMKILIDQESQYISQWHPWYVSAYNNPASQYSQYIWWNGPNNTQPQSFDLYSYDGTHWPVITLNMNTPAQIAYQKQMYARWIDPNGDGQFDDGVDGFRIDHIMDNLDYANQNTNLFANFWRPLFDTLRSINPKVFILCEQANWAEYGTATLNGSDADATFTIPLMFAVRSVNKTNIVNEIANTIAGTPAGKSQFLIIENHDVDRFASVVGGNAGLEKAGAAFTLLLPGVPCLYYGQELGMKGTKGNWGSDGNDIPNREAMEWHAARWGTGMAFWYNNGPWWSSSSVHDHDGISVEEEQADSSSLWSFYQKLIAVRKAHPALRSGTYSDLPNTNANVVAFGRKSSGDTAEVIASLVNLSGAAQNVALNLSTLLGSLPAPVGAADLLGSRTFATVDWSNISSYTVSLAPYEVVVIRFALASAGVHATTGWNLLSVPFKPARGLRTDLFPQSTSNAFAYAGSYVVAETLKTGRGYWLKFDSAATVILAGAERVADTLALAAGWNMIGPVSKPVAVSSIGSIPGGITTSPFFSYAGSYVTADTLRPGAGYWIRLSSAGALVLHASGSASQESALHIVADGELPPPPPDPLSESKPGLPKSFRLHQNFPNPFNPTTTIRFDLPVDARVTLRIYNVLGTEIAAPLEDAGLPAGYRQIVFDAHRIASGMYIYRIAIETMGGFSGLRHLSFTASRKMLVVK